jgi:dipeptidyl aminopeptidase/acylaminoacyl peptidase
MAAMGMLQRALGARFGIAAAVLVPLALGLPAQAQVAPPASHAIASAPTSTAAPPLEAYARLPQIEGATLSPDGSYFAAIINRGDEAVVVTRPVDGSSPLRAVMKTDNREQRFAWVHWVNNQRLVISIHFAAQRFGVDTTESRLVAVDRNAGKFVNLVQPAAFADARTYAQIQDRVIDWLPEDGHHILLMASMENRDVWPAVYKVDVDSGEREVVHGRSDHVRRWITDASHRVRVGVRQLGTQVEVRISDPNGENWRTGWRYELFDRSAVEPLGFGVDPQLLYVLADSAGHRALHTVDLRDAALKPQPRLSDVRDDVSGPLIRDGQTGEPVGVGGSRVDQLASLYWDPKVQVLARAIDAALPGRYNRILQFSADGSRYLLHSSGNGLPGQFLLGYRDQGQLTPLGREYPELSGVALPRKQVVEIAARDGLKVPGFLTLPLNAPGAAKPPAIILPHGGPISRDTLDFDPLSSFLASRGYAVLQVNFRGSAGMGFEFRNAGLKRWGLEMQDDLSDAAQWLVQRGTVDPARLCIVGGSYGGYAALMGGAKTPELFRCVVSVAGVSDLIDLGRRQAGYVNGADIFSKQIGSTWDDSQQLKATSPARLASSFKAPVLLVHGTDDRSVPFQQSVDMADALKAAGKPVKLVTLEGGDHYLSYQAHRQRFYRELEAFLAAHLGAGD